MEIPNFVSRMEQLNGYILLFPCQKDLTTLASPTIRRMNCSFSENELANIILKCFPRQFKKSLLSVQHGTRQNWSVMKLTHADADSEGGWQTETRS